MIDTIVDQEQLTILHPSLEIKPDHASVGFRHYVFKNGQVTEENVYFIAADNGIAVTNSAIIELTQGKAVFLIKSLALDTIDLEHLIWWAENPIPPDPYGLYKEIKEILQFYVELPDSSYGLISAWVIGTYLHRAFPCYPYLSFLGPKETGKSNTLECLKNLCFNAVKTKPSVAALGDTADALRGTIIID